MKQWFLFTVISAVFIGITSSCGDTAQTIHSDAKLSLDSLLLKYPDSVELLMKRANRSIDNFNYDGAMNDAAHAFRVDSNNLDVRTLYAEVLNNRPSRSIQDVVAAQRHYTYLLKKRPKNTEVLVGLASTFSFFREFDQSFRYINEALRIDARCRDAYVLKGSNYGDLGNPELMKSSYETAIQQDPEFFVAYVRLGAIYMDEQNPIAIEYFRTAHDLEPDDPEALYALAYAHQQFNQVEDASLLYREMLRDTSDYYVSQAYFQLGFLKSFYETPPDLDSAIYFYSNAIDVNPYYHEAYFQLGFCYDQKQDMTNALRMFGQSLKYNPGYAPARQFADSLKKLR